MIPIRDEIKARRVPYINYILIGINLVVFIFEFMAGSHLDAIVNQYALVPSQITSGLDLGDMRSILTSMFMHASCCLLYTSDAADDLLCVDLGGRRII